MNTLIITDQSYDLLKLKTLIDNLDKNVDWLSFQPLKNERCLHAVNFLHSYKFLEGEDHSFLLDKLHQYSNEILEVYDDKCHLDGLKYSRTLEYDFDHTVSSVFLKVFTLKKVLSHKKYDSIIFIRPKLSDHKSFQDSFILKRVYDFDWISLVCIDAKKVKTIFFDFPVIKNEKQKKSLVNEIKELKNNFFKLKRKLFNKKIDHKTVIISNTARCLSGFLKYIPKQYNIRILRPFNYEFEIDLEYSFSNKNASFELGNIELKLFSEYLDKIFYKKFKYYEKYYYELKKSIEQEDLPYMYITVNIADSKERMRLWVYKKLGVRVVWSAEGLGQFGEKTYKAFSKVIWAESNFEKWLLSDFMKQNYLNINKNQKLKVTGFLQSHLNRRPLPDYKNKKNIYNIIFACSFANSYSYRFGVAEQSYEIIKGVKDFCDVFGRKKEYQLIVKLHPGDYRNSGLYEELVETYHNVTINKEPGILHLLKKADLVVVVDSSVALEAIYYGKSVIVYNHMQRPTYLVDNEEYLNQNPELGPVAKVVKRKEELLDCASKFLMYEIKKNEENSFNFLLENYKKNYNMKSIVTSLFE